ncbi:MAG: sulfatase-like hydrolase/transferase, partial [Rubrobacteraceae bacterium]
MKSRWGDWRYIVVASCVILVLTAGCGEEKRSDAHDDPRPSDDRPNIVLVLADDFDPTLLRAMPETRREVRDRGVTLENAITTLPMCCPSRATILTGMYPHNHGVWYTRGIRSGWPAFHVRGLD